jgi:hypothetical protein
LLDCWTWSHDLGINAVANPYDLGLGYAPLSIDVRRALTGDPVWTPPHRFRNKLVNGILGGWTFADKFFLYTGPPFSVTDSKIPSQINSGGGIGTIYATVIDPQIARNCTYVTGSPGSPCYTQTSSKPTLRLRESTRRSRPISARPHRTFPRPGVLHRSDHHERFPIRERLAFEFGAQAYNLLNHPTSATRPGP